MPFRTHYHWHLRYEENHSLVWLDRVTNVLFRFFLPKQTVWCWRIAYRWGLGHARCVCELPFAWGLTTWTHLTFDPRLSQGVKLLGIDTHTKKEEEKKRSSQIGIIHTRPIIARNVSLTFPWGGRHIDETVLWWMMYTHIVLFKIWKENDYITKNVITFWRMKGGGLETHHHSPTASTITFRKAWNALRTAKNHQKPSGTGRKGTEKVEQHTTISSRWRLIYGPQQPGPG